MNPYINVCICISPGTIMDNDRIAKDIVIAEYIWHPISFHIEDVIVLNETYRFYDGEISYISPIKTQPKVTSFFEECSSLSPNCDIYICYIGSHYFQEDNVIACAYSLAMNKKLTGYIILTNAAASKRNIYTLAHELGHILFTRREQGKLTQADPHCPNGLEHHPSVTNLMHHIIPSPDKSPIDSLLTVMQRNLALKSTLLRQEKK